MAKALFKQADIDRFDTLINSVSTDDIKTAYTYIKNVTNNTSINIDGPLTIFVFAITQHRAEYTKYLSFNLEVNYMSENTESSYWLKDANYAGLQEGQKVTINLRPGVNHSNLSIAWILLHEFRHIIQSKQMNIKSNIDNKNLEMFINYLKSKGNSVDTINHVLHEVMPYEIDANMFACELLNIDYPGSKFEINDYTISLLK